MSEWVGERVGERVKEEEGVIGTKTPQTSPAIKLVRQIPTEEEEEEPILNYDQNTLDKLGGG